MKKGILLLLGIMSFATINATNITTKTSKIGVVNRYSDAVTFVERGVKFHVFLDGEFDYNTQYRNSRYVDYNGRKVKSNHGVRIERDLRGRVRRIGNVFVNYDFRGNVTRIGSVFIKYKFGQLYRVGHLKVKYDRWGNPQYKGYVKSNKHDDYYYDDRNWGIDIDINIGDIFDYDDVYFYRRDFKNNYRQFKQDNDFYYYRAAPNAKIGKRSKIIKRRKAKNFKKNYNKKLQKKFKKGSKRR